MTTILVVDDSPVDQHFAARCLQDEGCSVIKAGNGLEAIAVIKAQKPDAVLTDLQMPEMDGLALVRHIKQHHLSTPVILMTAHGSEEVAVQALRAGAASYVPKKNLQRDLSWALGNVLDAAKAADEKGQIRAFLRQSESEYELGYEQNGPRTLVSHLQESLALMNICDEVGRLQVATALTEAVTNAVDHGNLELDSKLREKDTKEYRRLGKERSETEPFSKRRVFVTARVDPAQAKFVVRDEGQGFDPNSLPDPTDPENLLKPSGRGVMLIRTFMDEVSFNDKGNEITMIKRHAD
jgi:CheY-like chemotaxis protein